MNNLSLYHLSEKYRDLFAKLYDPETGEVDQEIDEELSALSDTVEQKCVAVSHYIKRLEAEQKEIEFYKKEILEREAAYEKKIAQVNNYLKNNMERQGIKEIQCPQFTIKIKTNPYSTEILDETQIPEEFIRTRVIERTERKPDKTLIKDEVLQTGVQIPGAFVTQKTKLEIITDKI